jgi:hypothetical protein
MKKSLILSDEKRQARNKLVEINRLKRGKVIKQQCDDWVCIKYILKNIHLYENEYANISTF